MPTVSRRSAYDAAEKNRPLVDDIRLLGRILGDVIREQEGKEAFELIERVRQLSVAYRLKKDASAGRVLEWIDKAGYAAAAGWSGTYAVTAYVGNVRFTRPVEVGEWVGSDWIVTGGLQPGERVIIDGVMRIGPGAPVKVADAAAQKPAADAKAAQK